MWNPVWNPVDTRNCEDLYNENIFQLITPEIEIPSESLWLPKMSTFIASTLLIRGGGGGGELFDLGQAHDRLVKATPTFTKPQWTPQSHTHALQ